MTAHHELKVALAQVAPQPGDPSANLATAEQQAQRAAAQKADLLILPEMFLSGYAVGRAAVERLAEFDDGPSSERLAVAARKYGLGIIYGYPERTSESQLFNTVNFLDSDGTLLLKHRKLHFFGEVDRMQFDRSSAMPEVASWRGWNLGLGICYDVEFPEFVRSLALSGADLICVPTANMENFDLVPDLLVPARAVENQVFIAYANYCGSDQQYSYGGLSTLAAPSGESLTRARRGPELIVATIRRDELMASRGENPYLRDRRPDAYPAP